MDYSCDVLVEKNIFLISNKNVVKVFDLSSEKLIKEITLKETNINNIKIKLDQISKEKIYLLFYDTKGYIHVINLLKEEKIKKIKVHDDIIKRIVLSNTKNVLYSIDMNGILKKTDYLKGEILSIVNLNEKNKKVKNETFKFLELTHKEKFVIYNQNTKIKIYSFANETFDLISIFSSAINNMAISSDDKFLLVSTDSDYYVNIVNIKDKKIVAKILPETFCHLNKIIKVKDNIYHCFLSNKSNVFCYSFDSQSYEIIDKSFDIKFINDNLLCYFFDEVNYEKINVVYGNEMKIEKSKIKYAKNNQIKEGVVNVKVSKNESEKKTENKINLNNVKIINEIDSKEFAKLENIQNDYDSFLESSNNNVIIETNLVDDKISLINVLKNSIINNDIKTFEWALLQKNEDLINSTIKQMDQNFIKSFLNKLIELFQSNKYQNKNILIWIDSIINIHFFNLVNFDISATLKQLKIIIQNKTKYFNDLIKTQSKLENYMNICNKNSTEKDNNNNDNNNNDMKENFNAQLIYNESDSDENVNETKNKKIKKISEKNFKKKKLEKSKINNNENEDIIMNDEEEGLEDLDLLEEELNDQQEEEFNDEEEDEIDE